MNLIDTHLDLFKIKEQIWTSQYNWVVIDSYGSNTDLSSVKIISTLGRCVSTLKYMCGSVTACKYNVHHACVINWRKINGIMCLFKSCTWIKESLLICKARFKLVPSAWRLHLLNKIATWFILILFHIFKQNYLS